MSPSTLLGPDGRLLFLARAARMFAYGFLSVVLVLYLAGLGFDVTLSHRIPIFIHRRLAGDVNLVADLHHLGESGARVPKSFWLYDFPWHFTSFE